MDPSLLLVTHVVPVGFLAVAIVVVLFSSREARPKLALILGVTTILLSAGSVALTSGTAPARPATPAPTPTPTTAPSPAISSVEHVFVIIMENRSYAPALSTPYSAGLAKRYGLATNYHAVGSPSLPNYLALTSGSTWNIRDDAYHRLAPGGLGDQLTAAGVSWKAYFEGFTGDCLQSPYPYALKHNPFAYYGGACPSNIVPITQLAGDLAGSTPALSWITPGLCNDGHDCPDSTADSWLAETVPTILASPAWQRDGLLVITWDEGSTDDHVATLLIAPNQTARQSATPYNHYSLLATIEDRLGVGRLGLAAGATAMTDLLR